MHICRHCGRENPEDAALCAECWRDPQSSPTGQSVSPERVRSGGFFRWRVTSIILIVLTIIYGISVPLNFWFAKLATQRGDLQATSREWFWGAVWNIPVVILCFAAWQLMRRRSRTSLVMGAYAVTAALLIVMRTWLAALISGHNPFPDLEAVFTWLPMLYAIIYAHRESKRVDAA
jgi:hypothetical protein